MRKHTPYSSKSLISPSTVQRTEDRLLLSAHEAEAGGNDLVILFRQSHMFHCQRKIFLSLGLIEFSLYVTWKMKGVD